MTAHGRRSPSKRSAEAEFWNVSSKQIVLAVAVVAAGVCAAWPFRRDLNGPLPAAAIETNVTELTLRQQDVTLAASPVSEPSPATGLGELTDIPESQAQDALAAAPRPPLEALGLPPEMPPVFRSLILPVAQGSYPAQGNRYDPFEPRAAVGNYTTNGMYDGRPTRLPPRPIRHRIVDGDTLEKLAEQYLGDPSRARDIFEANRRVLDDPQLLPLGKVIELPPQQATELEPVVPSGGSEPANPL